MSNGKVKGLLKGLKHIFENEKEAEMQIGLPTDVKHVAHIGWDGPSVNSPSWMNEFQAAPSVSSAPLSLPAPGEVKADVSAKWVSEDGGRGAKGSNSAARSPADVAKPSRHPSSDESPTARERSERHKARRSSKAKESSDQKETNNDIPRTGRRKKTSRTKAHGAETYKSAFSDPGTASATGSISISKDLGLCQTP